MKRSSSSLYNNRDNNSSRSKRIREDTPMRQEERVNISMIIQLNFQVKRRRDEIDDDTYPNITTSTASASSISFSSSSKTAPTLPKNTIASSKDTASSLNDKSSSLNNKSSSLKSTSSSSDDTSPSSSSKVLSSSSNNTTSSTKFNKKSHRESSPSSQLHKKDLCIADGIVNASVVSQNSSTKQISVKEKKKSASLNTSSTDAFNRNTANSYSKVVSASASTNKKQMTTVRNFSQFSTVNHLSSFDRASSSSSTSLNDSNNSNKTTFPIQSLVEGSLEYREMKRKYLKEQENAEEWRKDYNVLKQQLAYLKSTTIPRPTAEVMEWLQELFDLINKNGKFKGDEQTLNEIGNKLVLDKTSLVTVHARTPQKSSLKLFRLLYPTVGSRARCGSISQVPTEQLDYIYLYVRNLHKNLNFTRKDMRKAIGTCIRSANSELRKFEQFQQQDENVDPDEPANDPNDIENALDGTEDITDEEEEKEYDDEAEAEAEDDEVDDEDDDKEVNNLMMDDELDEADE